MEKKARHSLLGIVAITTLVVAATFIQGCRKAGLIDSSGHVDIIGSYRITEENTDYLFFELAENSDVIEHALWFYALDRGDGDFLSSSATWKPLDLSTGVHQHRFFRCGDNTLCGSFSWPSQPKTSRIALRMLYNSEGDAELTTSASIRDTGNSPSAMLYGVFDSPNKHVQVRVEDNFGVPSRINVKRYGMTRKFQVRAPTDTSVSSDVIKALRTTRNDNYLFPADFCTTTKSLSNAQVFTGWSGWLAGTFDPNDGTNGTCMNIDFLDKNEQTLVQHTAYARRNPVFLSGSYKYNTPLTDTIKIPLIIDYCAGAIGSAQARDADFFDYQRSIIGFASQAADLCTRVGGETTFRTSLTALLASKLTAAKAASSSTRDFVFTVVLHQNLSSEFQTFQQIISEQLAAIISSDANSVSPRLAGGFIYDSNNNFSPSSVQEHLMVWCPQQRPSDPSSTAAAIQEVNCMVTDPIKIGNNILNFVTPMGPFPTMSAYRNYVNQYSDKGIAKEPDLSFSSVPKNGSTFTETSTTDGTNYTVSYFDNEHFIINATDHVRTCWDRDSSNLLASLRLRNSTQSSTTPGIMIDQATTAWDVGQGTGDYRIGVAWDIPFVGKVTYKSALTANFVSLIPVSRSFNSYQALGDPKWTASTLDFGSLLQVCKQYCSHPVFDESGTYQISTNFNDTGFLSCVTPKYPTFGEQ